MSEEQQVTSSGFVDDEGFDEHGVKVEAAKSKTNAKIAPKSASAASSSQIQHGPEEPQVQDMGERECSPEPASSASASSTEVAVGLTLASLRVKAEALEE